MPTDQIDLKCLLPRVKKEPNKGIMQQTSPEFSRRTNDQKQQSQGKNKPEA